MSFNTSMTATGLLLHTLTTPYDLTTKVIKDIKEFLIIVTLVLVYLVMESG